MDMNNTREQIYEYIKQYIGEHGYAPSFRDICDGANLSGPSVAKYHVDALTAIGLLTYEPGLPRTIRVVELADEPQKG